MTFRGFPVEGISFCDQNIGPMIIDVKVRELRGKPDFLSYFANLLDPGQAPKVLYPPDDVLVAAPSTHGLDRSKN